MSLLTSCNEGAPGTDYFVLNAGTSAAPVIVGNPVQLCTGGAFAGASGAVDTITAGGAAGSSVLQLGNAGLANCMSFGPGQAASLTSQVTMIPNANLQVGQFTQIIVNPNPAITPAAGSGLLTVNTNGRLEIIAGGILDFNNAGAPRGTFRATVALPTPFNDGVTTTVANPPGIIEGAYAVMVDGVAGDGQAARQIASVAYYDGLGEWRGGACVEANNMSMAPLNDRSALTITNSTGGALTNLNVFFVLLAGAAGV